MIESFKRLAFDPLCVGKKPAVSSVEITMIFKKIKMLQTQHVLYIIIWGFYMQIC